MNDARRKGHRSSGRVRRSPEEARRLILQSAQRVFSERGPDAAGLKDVAREAGVSHGLITHYFGTYDALVEATMEQVTDHCRDALVARLAELDEPSPQALLETFFRLIAETPLGRLFAWALLSGRFGHEDFFARRVQGPRQLADILEARIRTHMPQGAAFDRDELDYLILLVLSVGVGIGAGRGTMWEALGREPSPAQTTAFREWLGALIENRIETIFGLKRP